MRKQIKFFGLGLGLAAAMAVVPARAQFDPQWGGVDDVPTWQTGDSWNFDRSFQIGIGDNTGQSLITIDAGFPLSIYPDLDIDFTDSFTLETTGTQAVTNSAVADPIEAYVRTRTAGTLDAVVSGIIGGDPFFSVGLTVTGGASMVDSSTGENWIGVGDLAQIRERFLANASGALTLSGDPTLCMLLDSLAGVMCDTPIPFTLDVDLGIDHGASAPLATDGALELHDFPTLDPFADNGTGERHTLNGVRRLVGSLALGIPGLLDPPASIPLDLETGISYRTKLEAKGVADPNATFADNRFLVGETLPNDDLIYFSPTAKEMSYWQIGDLVVPVMEAGDPVLDFDVYLNDFTTAILLPGDANVAGDPDFSMITITPPQPEQGLAFTLAGSSASGTMVTAEILATSGAVLQTVGPVPITGGGFTINMTAPTPRDVTLSTPPTTNIERGSFGIRLTRDDSAVKVVTVRTRAPNSVEAWEGYR